MTKQEQLNAINDAIKQTKTNLKPLGFNLTFWSIVIISMSLFHYFFPRLYVDLFDIPGLDASRREVLD